MKLLSKLLLGACSSLLLGTLAGAQTVTVTTAADAVDIDWSVATIADLPGPDGKVSLSEALIATNNTPGHQTIAFAVPQGEWTLQFAYPGRAVLTSSVGFFFHADEAVTIDGTTQTAFTGDTNPDGNEVVINASSLRLNGDNCTLIGIDSSAVDVNGNACTVLGNTGTMNITVFGGSGSLIQGNTGGTIKIDRSSGNVVVGNTVNRVRVLGWVGGGQPAANNRIGGPALADRNFITGYGSYSSSGVPSGQAVQIFDAHGTVVQNNYIGTTPDGMAQGNSACTIGIEVDGDIQGLVVRDNLISGIKGVGIGSWAGTLWGWGILIGGTGNGIDILGNGIGVDALGQPTLGAVWGVSIADAVTDPSSITDVRIGGFGPGEGNVIAGHRLNGITVGGNSPPVRIQGNAIHTNEWLGIDLKVVNYGVTPNDPLDADVGPNGLQNFPELASASYIGGNLRVTGTLRSEPLTSYTVELYASGACDSYAGYGEGETWLGAFPVTTNAAGDAPFDELLSVTLTGSEAITAIATNEATGATSEFSACATLVDPTFGAAYCFGDGSGSACPCGNVGATGHGCANGGGLGALLVAAGSDSVAAGDAQLFVLDAAPSQPGLFFQGTTTPGSGAGIFFGDGLRCAGGQVVRLGVAFATAAGIAQSALDMAAAGGVSAGLTRYYQFWYRDPLGSPCGASFNLSNGVQIDWQP